jgi:hypothetical protein
VTAGCAVGYLLENPSICSLLAIQVTPPCWDAAVDDSDNASSAENQQERLIADGWIVGFVDGDGCFSCPIQRNSSMTLGWQVQPRFVVVQGASSENVFEDLARYFGCGRVYRNRRGDNHREDLCVYSVYRLGDLWLKIVPFFEQNPLRTAKRENFAKFARIVELMRLGRHLSLEGLVQIAEIAETMNFRKPSEVLRILRDHTPTLFANSREEDEMARSLWRHREADGDVQPADQGSPPGRSSK